MSCYLIIVFFVCGCVCGGGYVWATLRLRRRMGIVSGVG